MKFVETRNDTTHLKKMGGIIAECNVCFSKIKGSLRINSNFLGHLQRQHPSQYVTFQSEKNNSQEVCKTTTFDQRVLDFVANTYSPLSIVDSPFFKNLFIGTNRIVKSRRAMTTLLKEKSVRFQVCSNVWSKCNRPKTAEVMKTNLGCYLKTPTVTRWNFLYDSIKDILLHKKNVLSLCNELDIPKFSQTEIDYLEEFVLMMKPIADALDYLQREEKMYFGYFLPTIISVKVKLEKIEDSDLKELSAVNKELQHALYERFSDYFEVNKNAEDAIVAAISCPNIKLRFVKGLEKTAPSKNIESFKQLFVKHASNFTVNPAEDLEQNDARKELDLYLADSDESFQCFQRFPRIREVFLKYNTPLASSAPVERLFSFAGMVNTPRRRSLSDKNFENLVIIRGNNLD
ncbi:hypothetical protein CVS40_6376 [Lucilia cuprina]|nr:hypothetical protein CVS40_6376 [Lucilia cuprina]